MGRKKQKPEESAKRRQILKAAGKIFMTQSYSAVSMDALAGAVPVSKRTLYNHFKDKETLFTAVMQARCQIILGGMERTFHEGKNVRQTLTGVARKFLDVVFESDSLNIYRTALMQAQDFPELGKLFYESGPSRATGILAEYLREKSEAGELRVKNPRLAATMFLGMLTNRMQMKCLLGVKKNVTESEKEEIIRYAVDVFLNGQVVS